VARRKKPLLTTRQTPISPSRRARPNRNRRSRALLTALTRAHRPRQIQGWSRLQVKWGSLVRRTRLRASLLPTRCHHPHCRRVHQTTTTTCPGHPAKALPPASQIMPLCAVPTRGQVRSKWAALARLLATGLTSSVTTSTTTHITIRVANMPSTGRGISMSLRCSHGVEALEAEIGRLSSGAFPP